MADNLFVMDKRFKDIHTLLASYSEGHFEKRLPLSDELDDTDALISGLHMLAEELKAVTITRDYFNNIFNTVSEMVVVLTAGGVIEEVNKAVSDRMGYLKRVLVGRPVDVLTGNARPSLFRQLRRQRGPDGLVRIWNRSFLTMEGQAFPVDITARILVGRGTRGQGAILLTAKDITVQLATENKLLRAVIAAQEQERARLARDLHDGLTQQLSAVKFLVSVAVKECGLPVLRDKLQAANESLFDILGMMRGVCYNLMPKALEDFGLVQAVREMAEQVQTAGIMRVVVEEGRHFPVMEKAMEIDLFRVIQEFMANGIRHGEATYMLVRFEGKGQEVEVRLKENGKGFEPALVQGQGMGIRNMHSRIRSHEGAFLLSSSPGKGTEARIRLTVNS
jgi:PAS domain S-box-containing protein